jgi:hypothetical protein
VATFATGLGLAAAVCVAGAGVAGLTATAVVVAAGGQHGDDELKSRLIHDCRVGGDGQQTQDDWQHALHDEQHGPHDGWQQELHGPCETTVPAAAGTRRGCDGVPVARSTIWGVRAVCGVAAGFVPTGVTTVTFFGSSFGCGVTNTMACL